jgi:RNA polymerase sigma-70 factor (ECF subfamily)
VAQRVFLTASQKLAEIAVGRERSFLFSTAAFAAANARRAHARRREVMDDELLDAQVDPSPDGERVVEMKERRRLLDQVLAEMPDDLRTVFVLFVLEGMSSPEIAELLEIPTGTVASRLRRAREAFHTISKRLQARLCGRGSGRAP